MGWGSWLNSIQLSNAHWITLIYFRSCKLDVLSQIKLSLRNALKANYIISHVDVLQINGPNINYQGIKTGTYYATRIWLIMTVKIHNSLCSSGGFPFGSQNQWWIMDSVSNGNGKCGYEDLDSDQIKRSRPADIWADVAILVSLIELVCVSVSLLSLLRSRRVISPACVPIYLLVASCVPAVGWCCRARVHITCIALWVVCSIWLYLS